MDLRRHLRFVVLLLLPAAFVACKTSTLDPEEIRVLYNRPAGAQYPDRNPVIVIPGSGGSRLVHHPSGKVIWGEVGGNVADPSRAEDVPLIALPLRPGAPPEEVGPDGVLEYFQVNLLGLDVQLKAYFHILATLGAGGYRDETAAERGTVQYDDDHYTCFQFDYDWRQDLVANAARLHDFIEQKQAQVRAKSRERFGVDPGEVRFDIVSHSLGGLLTRYYLRYGNQPLPEDGSLPVLDWRGARRVERTVLIGPPNAGSYKTVLQLMNGVQNGPGLPNYGAAVVGSFPASFQMLPRTRHGAVVVDHTHPPRRLDLLDPQVWIDHRLGILHPDQEEVLALMLPEVPTVEARHQVAVDFLRRELRRTDQFFRALDVPSETPPGTELLLIASDSEPTGRVVAVDPLTGAARVAEKGPGDGSVLRSSALMDERTGGEWRPHLVSPISWEDVLFISGRHFWLTRNPQFTNNLLYRLLEEPRRYEIPLREPS